MIPYLKLFRSHKGFIYLPFACIENNNQCLKGRVMRLKRSRKYTKRLGINDIRQELKKRLMCLHTGARAEFL